MNDYAKDMLQPWWHRPLFYFRWATFIPGGLLGGMLAALAIGLFVGASMWLSGYGTFFSPLTLLVAAAASGAGMIYAAAYIAPTDDKRVPVGIMVPFAILFWLLNLPYVIAEEDWFEGFRVLVAIVAGIVAAVTIYKDQTPAASDESEPTG